MLVFIGKIVLRGVLRQCRRSRQEQSQQPSDHSALQCRKEGRHGDHLKAERCDHLSAHADLFGQAISRDKGSALRKHSRTASAANHRREPSGKPAAIDIVQSGSLRALRPLIDCDMLATCRAGKKILHSMPSMRTSDSSAHTNSLCRLHTTPSR